MTGPSPTVIAVVVAFQPDPGPLVSLIDSLLRQVDGVVIVDNTPREDRICERIVSEFDDSTGRLRLFRLGRNLGIAAAINTGIQIAIEAGFDYVLLSDQDSLPAEDMVRALLRVAISRSRCGDRVGAVMPMYIDAVTGQVFGFQIQRPGRIFYSTCGADEARPWVEVLSGISSGSLAPTAVFTEVGMMREDYFIDYVDTEWFHRARAHGYRLFGTAEAVLGHRLGESSFPVWYMQWRPFTGYSPQRLYYRFRNFVAMFREPHVPFRWKLRASWYWIGNAYAYLLFAPNRLVNARHIARGLWHGFRGRMGRYDG